MPSDQVKLFVPKNYLSVQISHTLSNVLHEHDLPFHCHTFSPGIDPFQYLLLLHMGPATLDQEHLLLAFCA